MPHIDSPLQEPHPRHASATIVTTEREYIPPKPPTRNILPRGSPHKRTPIGQRAGVSAVWDRPGLVIGPPQCLCGGIFGIGIGIGIIPRAISFQAWTGDD